MRVVIYCRRLIEEASPFRAHIPDAGLRLLVVIGDITHKKESFAGTFHVSLIKECAGLKLRDLLGHGMNNLSG